MGTEVRCPFSDADKLCSQAHAHKEHYLGCFDGFGETAQDCALWTPLMYAAMAGSLECVEPLWQIPLSKSVLSICRLNIHDWARYLVDLGADAGALSMQQEIKSMIS